MTLPRGNPVDNAPFFFGTLNLSEFTTDSLNLFSFSLYNKVNQLFNGRCVSGDKDQLVPVYAHKFLVNTRRGFAALPKVGECSTLDGADSERPVIFNCARTSPPDIESLISYSLLTLSCDYVKNNLYSVMDRILEETLDKPDQIPNMVTQAMIVSMLSHFYLSPSRCNTPDYAQYNKENRRIHSMIFTDEFVNTLGLPYFEISGHKETRHLVLHSIIATMPPTSYSNLFNPDFVDSLYPLKLKPGHEQRDADYSHKTTEKLLLDRLSRVRRRYKIEYGRLMDVKDKVKHNKAGLGVSDSDRKLLSAQEAKFAITDKERIELINDFKRYRKERLKELM